MKYITVKQFEIADKKVQEAIMKWWKPEHGDLFAELIDSGLERKACILCKDRLDTANNNKIYPLLTLGQLIDFIEHYFDGKLEYSMVFSSSLDLIVKVYDSEFMEYMFFEIFESESLLEAMWRVANNAVLGDYGRAI